MKNKNISNVNDNNTNEYENELIEKKLDSMHNDIKKYGKNKQRIY